MIAGERNLGLLGARNFRDLGGYVAAGGARTRWGRVFRSDALLLEAPDFVTFARLGVRAIYDLRSDTERELTPNRLPPGGHAVELLPCSVKHPRPPTIDAMLADGETVPGRHLSAPAGTIGRHLGAHSHRPGGRIPSAGGLSLRRGQRPDRDRRRPPAVRPRRGRGGHPRRLRADVAIPHARSDGCGYRPAARRAGRYPRSRRRHLRTPRWAMQGALAELGGRYGGIDGYLVGPAGMDASVPDVLCALLLA